MDPEIKPNLSAAVCPICGNPNDCAIAADHDAEKCWCEEVEFPQELLDRALRKALHKSCICRNCLERFLSERNGGD